MIAGFLGIVTPLLFHPGRLDPDLFRIGSWLSVKANHMGITRECLFAVNFVADHMAWELVLPESHQWRGNHPVNELLVTTIFPHERLGICLERFIDFIKPTGCPPHHSSCPVGLWSVEVTEENQVTVDGTEQMRDVSRDHGIQVNVKDRPPHLEQPWFEQFDLRPPTFPSVFQWHDLDEWEVTCQRFLVGQTDELMELRNVKITGPFQKCHPRPIVITTGSANTDDRHHLDHHIKSV